MHQAADMSTSRNTSPTWDEFVDLVLPWVGTARLEDQLAMVVPTLSPAERALWAQRFNRADSAHQDRFADAAGWTEEEADGVWYDAMKAIALDCIDATRQPDHA